MILRPTLALRQRPKFERIRFKTSKAKSANTFAADPGAIRELDLHHRGMARTSADEGIEKYLGSGMIRCIGPVYAKSWFAPRNVKRISQERGLTPELLTERSGFSRQYISGLEQGRRNPTIVSIYELAIALGFSHTEFVRPIERQ